MENLLGTNLLGYPVFVYLFSLLLYISPLGIAYLNNHPKLLKIALLNIALGWTGVGWLAALIWAAYHQKAIHTPDELQRMREIHNQIWETTQKREAAAAQHRDEDFFEAIKSLPDCAFKVVASRIRLPREFEKERGMACPYIRNEDLEEVKRTTEKLEQMGLLYWFSKEERPVLRFNDKLIQGRLVGRQDLIGDLEQDAHDRKIELKRV